MGTLYAASYCSTTGGFNSVQLFYPESTIIGIHTILLLQLNNHSHAKHPYYAEIKKKLRQVVELLVLRTSRRLLS